MTGSRKECRRREDADEVLDASLELFVSQGYGGTSVHQIAERAEFSVGKIYTLFPSKDAILSGLQDRGLRELNAVLDQAVDPAAPPLASLHAILRTAFAFATTYRGLIRMEIAEQVGRPRRSESLVHDLFVQRARALLDQAVSDGSLHRVDTTLLAIMLLGAGEALVDALAPAAGDDPFAEIPDRIMELMVLPHRRGEEDKR